MPDLRIPIQDYKLSPYDYWWRAESVMSRLISDPRPDWLFYAALEFRFCIEQTLRSYLELLQVEWTKPLRKMYRATELKKAILSAEPEFVQKLAFVDVLLHSVHPEGVYQIDLDRVNGLYGRLGAYLHAPLDQDATVKDPDWWNSFTALLFEVKEYLYEVLRRPMAALHLEGDGWSAYERWKAGDATDAEIQQEFVDGFKKEENS
jgi:hypothetical protein